MNKNMQPLNKGQSLIEFALIVPVLLLLLFGIIDLGRIVYVYSAIQNSAREGARYGIIDYNTSIIESRVRSSAAGLDQSVLQVFPSYVYDNDTVEVVVRYRFRAITPIIPSLFGFGEIQLRAQTTMMAEK